MQPFNIEIFDRDFDMVQHYNADTVIYSYDYLNLAENVVVTPYNDQVQRGQYIRVYRGVRDYFGIISGLDVGNPVEGYTEIRYKPFLAMFDAPVIFDTDLQPGGGSGSTVTMEQVIAQLITDYWINNTDTNANIPGLSVYTISETPDWGLHLTSDVQGQHKTIVNFKDTIIQRALTKYQIAVIPTVHLDAKKITVAVGRRETGTFYIEADLPSVISRKIVLNSTTEDTNKLTVLDSSDMLTSLTYYKHPDGTYDTQNTDRIVPVIAAIQTVTPTDETPFADGAQLAADRMFDRDTYNNLIEIEVQNEDEMVLPAMLTIGQIVSVITEGYNYPSIMTGVTVGQTTRIIFGTVRVELTKRVRRLIRDGGSG